MKKLYYFKIVWIYTLLSIYCGNSISQETLSIPIDKVHCEDGEWMGLSKGETIFLQVWKNPYPFINKSKLEDMQKGFALLNKGYSFVLDSVSSIKVLYADIYGKHGWRYGINFLDESTNTFYIILDKNKTKELDSTSFQIIFFHELGHLLTRFYTYPRWNIKRRVLEEMNSDFIAGYLINKVQLYSFNGDSENMTFENTFKQLYGNGRNLTNPNYPTPKDRNKLFQEGLKYKPQVYEISPPLGVPFHILHDLLHKHY